MTVKRGKDEYGIVHEVVQVWKTVVGTRCNHIWNRESRPSSSYQTLFLLKNGNNNPITCMGCIGA